MREAFKKDSERFSNNIYFNPKKRAEFRKLFIKSRKNFIENLEELPFPTQSIEVSQQRIQTEGLIDQMTRMIDLVDNVVPRKLKEFELTNTSFKLYKKRGSKQIAIKCSYKKGIPKKSYKTTMLVPCGFPKKGKKTKAQMIRKDIKLNGYDQTDEGSFTQKLHSFSKAEQEHKGKNKTIKFILTQRGEIKDNNWLKLL